MDLASFFRACVRKYPDKTALVFEGKHFTYREMDKWSDSIASFLAGRIACGQTIGVAMRRSPEWIATLLGIWKAGGVYVPLDLDNPRKRLMTIAEDCDLSFVICDNLGHFCPNNLPVFLVGQMGDSNYPCPEKCIDGDAPAYIIYTSGTTGMPKGVPITHKQTLLMGGIGGRKVFRLKDGERMLQIAGIGFSVSLVEVTTCLFNGGCMVMSTEDERHDPQRLVTLLERERVACAFIPPVLLAVMPYASLPNLHTIVVGGEGLSGPVISRWMHRRRLVNAYGFTENAVHVMNGEYNPGTKPNDIGTPVPGVSAFVVDESLNPVPDGMPGELCVSGRQLVSGYWKHPELSEEKFIVNPFATETEKQKGRNLVLYRSGDKVIRQPDGRYLYLGRIDNQIKIRGVRIELGEIERHLNSYPGVLSSVVLPKRHNGKTTLVAYLQTTQSIEQEKIAAYLQGLLPDYMCPQRVVTLEEFPLTPNGKTDKARLPEPDWTHTGTLKTPPSTTTEKTVARIWSRMLDCGPVNREDDFIALGGDSISVMLMADELEKAFGFRLEAADIYRRKGLAELAKFMDEKLAGRTDTSHDGGTEAYEPPAPLGNLLVDCLQSDDRNKAYKLAVFIPFEKDLDIQDLQEAWNRMVCGQDSMRIFFKREDDGMHCVHTAPFHKVDVPVKDIRTEDFLLEAHELYRQPFDPEQAPLHRECIYRFSDGTCIMVLVIHHLIADGWSLRLLVHTLKELCRKGIDGSEPYKEAYGYREYAKWYRQYLELPATEKKQAFWRSYMAGCHGLALSGNILAGHSAGQQGFALSVPMSPQSKDALDGFARSRSVTPFAVCLCVYQVLLMKYSGQDDFAVGAAFTDRRTPEQRKQMGYMTTLLPVRSLASGGVTFADMVERMTRNILLLSDNSLPLDMIGASLGRDQGKDGGEQLLRFAFGLEEVPSPLDIPDEWTTSASFDLALSVYRKGHGYSYHYQYVANRFDAAFLNTFSRSFDAALLYLTAHPEECISACPLLPADKIGEIVRGFRFADMDRHLPDVVTGFERAAQECPDRTVCVWNGIRTTYGELQTLSARIAAAVCHRLESMGINSAPVTVGVRMEEKRYMLPMLLGILKSGNCYVPLDAALPEGRLAFIREDADVRLLLCDRPFRMDGCDILTAQEAMTTPVETEVAAVRPEDTAYIIYTSGTTGHPKGTAITHGALSLFADSQSKLFRLQPGASVLQYANIGFDASVLEIFPALLSQATLVVPTEEERKDADLLLGLMEREKVGCALIPPALLALLPYRRLPHLKVLAVGGESTPEEVMRKWSEGRTLLNEYGPTENTVVTTCATYDAGSRANDIGRALPGVSCYVVNKDMNLMPDGVPGELCIGGLQLTSGYLHRDDLNREKFTDNPFVLEEDRKLGLNTRLYHSGDKVVRTAGGHFLYLGRMDTQVKLRGFRIETDEIARRLEQHHTVRQALAVLKKSEAGHPYIAAYVVSENGEQAEPEVLDRYLRTHLPHYMIPSAWRVMEQFPLTLNGKVDRSSLPEVFLLAAGEYVPPAGHEEEVLAGIAAKLLETERVSVGADLLDLGLSSLQVVELVYEARKEGMLLSATDIYKERCIRNILQRRSGDHFFWNGHVGNGGKPLMVVIGYPTFKPFYDGFVARFKEKYDFFVFESFLDTLSGDMGCSAEELADHYCRTVVHELTGRQVDAVVGYCLGGEIAMLLAEKLRNGGFPAVKALVAEGFPCRDKRLLMPLSDKDRRLREQARIANELITTMPPFSFGGRMIVCLATRPSNHCLFGHDMEYGKEWADDMQAMWMRNRDDWRRLYPDAVYCEVDADHLGVLEEKHMEILYQVVCQHWAADDTTKTDNHEK